MSRVTVPDNARGNYDVSNELIVFTDSAHAYMHQTELRPLTKTFVAAPKHVRWFDGPLSICTFRVHIAAALGKGRGHEFVD